MTPAADAQVLGTPHRAGPPSPRRWTLRLSRGEFIRSRGRTARCRGRFRNRFQPPGTMLAGHVLWLRGTRPRHAVVVPLPAHQKGTKATELDSVAQTPYMPRGTTWTTGVDSVGRSCGVPVPAVGTWTGWGQPGFPTDVLHTGVRARRWLRDRRMRRAAGEMYTFPHPLLLLLICISLLGK